MKTTFQLDQITALVVGDAYYDLHNCFDFVGVEYRPTEKKARLEWQCGEGNWEAKNLPMKLILLFEGVTNYAAQRRDASMPFSEDSCVASITFLPPGLNDHFEAVCPAFRCDDEHLSIMFQSGSGIKIWAEQVTHAIELA